VPEPEDDVEIEEGAAQPHALWSGSISFGLLSLPVDLFPASRSPALSLRMVDDGHRPLTRRYYCPSHDRFLSRDEIVRGYEIDKDQYVVVSDEELESVAPDKSRAIDLRRFVKASDIDPMYFKRSYFLTPGEEEAGRAYRLLAETMERSDRVGIASFVMRGKEYLVALLAEKGILRAETLRFRDELRSAADVGLNLGGKAPRQTVQRFLRAVAELAADEVDAEELRDGSVQRLHSLIDSKLERGVDVERAPAPEAVESEAQIIDLMEVLKRRLQPEAQERSVAAGNGERKQRAARGRDGGDDELASKSRSELYERAKALQVPGRSKMDKGELLRALRDAGA
jgi:DNA end-binding protein Ku